MITVLMFADKITLQCCDDMFDTINTLTINDNIEFLFENSCIYKKMPFQKEYKSLKNDERFFRYTCYELYSGDLFRYLLNSLNNDGLKRHSNNAHIFVVGASKELLNAIVQNYNQELNFTVKAFLKQDGKWQWKIIHDEIQLDTIDTENNGINPHSSSNQEIKLKELKSPQQRKKKNKAAITVIVLLFLIATVIFFYARNVSDKKKETTEQQTVETTTEIQKETVNKEEIIQQAEGIFRQYFMEEISYEDAENAIKNFPEIESDEISKILSDMTDILHSREAYQAGQQAVDSGNYKEAVGCFKNVIEKDTNYYRLAQSESKLAVSEYKTNEKEKAEETALSGNYGDAYLKLRTLAEEFPDDKLLVDECTDKQKKYMDEWINVQRQYGNYFQEDGAVVLAYSYQYFNMDGGIDSLLQEAYSHEREQLINMLNQKRAELGYEPMNSNDGLIIRAEGDARLIKEGREDEIYSDYNIYFYRAKNAENAMGNYVQIEGIGEFVENTKSIGVGILFDEEEMTCIWVVLTASETDI